MNDNTVNRSLKPSRAIIIYSDKGSNYYLESREIKTVAGKPTLLAPVPMADNIMKDVAKSYLKTNSAEMGHASLIDPQLLYALNEPGKTIIMWYRPAMKRSLNFSKSFKLPVKAVTWVPATLYVLMGGKLYIFAMMDDKRPTGDTKLYNAPFLNIYEDGNVCLGTAHTGKRRAKTFEKEAERFERGFYMAEQNGHNGTKACKKSLITIYAELIKSKKQFPGKKQLIQHPKYKTLETLIEKLIGNDYEEDEDDIDLYTEGPDA